MMKLKIGDRIRFAYPNASGWNFLVGQAATVARVLPGGHRIDVKWDNPEFRTPWNEFMGRNSLDWKADRFRKIKPLTRLELRIQTYLDKERAEIAQSNF